MTVHFKARARLLLTELIVGLRPGTTTVKRGEAVLQLESEPRSLVFLEGVEQGNTPLVLTVPTDRPAEILAVAEGYQDYSNLFELKSGELRKIKIPNWFTPPWKIRNHLKSHPEQASF